MGISIGIRELRQNASRYLRLVRAGQTITLTDRGQPFAEIRPVKQPTSVLEQLIAEGRATAPTGSIQDFLDKHPPQPPRPGDPKLSDVVIQARAEERN
jgi:prevent-host-death family protein